MPQRLVVDSSVVSKFYLLDEELVPQAHAVLRAYAAGDVELIAPFAVLYEVPSSIRRAVNKRRIDWARAHELVDSFLALNLSVLTPDILTSREIIRRAFDLCDQLDRSFYDAIFVAFSEALEVPLLTADRPLATSAREVIDVVFLEDFELP